MLRVWIGNLGKYNEGELVGDWLELPVTNKELESFLREKVGLQLTQKEVDESLAKYGVCYEEYMINDYETDLPINVSEYSNLSMLNLLAKASERVTNMEAVEAFIECENTDDIEEIINIMLQEDRIPYYTYGIENDTLSKEEKYGMQKAENMGITELLQKHNIENYFDYEEYGNEDDLSGYVELFDEGYIDRSETNAVDLHLYSSEEIKEELSDEEITENKKLRIIYKEVGKDPTIIEIDDTLEAKQKLVGGLIEVVPYKDNLLLICNEEGKITNLKPNLKFDYDYIAGNCFVVGDDYENAGFKSIADNQIEDICKDLKERTIILEEIQEVEETEEMEM